MNQALSNVWFIYFPNFAGQQIVYPFLGNLLANSSELQRILQDDYQLAPGLVEAMLTLCLSPDKVRYTS